MSRLLNDVATFSLLLWMSGPLNDVATSFPCFCCRDCLMMLQPHVFAIDVATFFLCKLMLRQLLIWKLMLRLLNDVATLISLQADVTTASDSVLTSRPLLDVAISIFSFLKILCRDFYLVSRPPCLLFCIQFCRDLM